MGGDSGGSTVMGKVATANYLRGGEIVYFTESHQWSLDLKDALVAYDD